MSFTQHQYQQNRMFRSVDPFQLLIQTINERTAKYKQDTGSDVTMGVAEVNDK